MTELSLHILDVAKNSTAAKASLVEITVDEDTKNNRLTISINDDGCGMSPDLLKRVRDPFTTTRTTRKVGLGIPLFEQAALQAGGGFDIISAEGSGTCVTAWFVHDSIDRQPLGDMPSTISALIMGSPEIDFIYRHAVNEKDFTLDTREVRQILQGVPLDNIDVIAWISEFITENSNSLRR